MGVEVQIWLLPKLALGWAELAPKQSNRHFKKERERERSRSPKAGHNKAGRSDFRNQRFEPDMGKMRKMRKAPLTLQKQGSEDTPQSKNAENAENAENADTKTRKMRKCGWLALMWLAVGDPQERERKKKPKIGTEAPNRHKTNMWQSRDSRPHPPPRWSSQPQDTSKACILRLKTSQPKRRLWVWQAVNAESAPIPESFFSEKQIPSQRRQKYPNPCSKAKIETKTRTTFCRNSNYFP